MTDNVTLRGLPHVTAGVGDVSRWDDLRMYRTGKSDAEQAFESGGAGKTRESAAALNMAADQVGASSAPEAYKRGFVTRMRGLIGSAGAPQK